MSIFKPRASPRRPTPNARGEPEFIFHEAPRSLARSLEKMHFTTYFGTNREDEETRSKLTLATPSIFGMAITLCAARAPQATTLVMVAVVVHCGGGLRMRRSSKSMSSSSSSARSGAARGIGARTRVAHCGARRSREGG